MDIAPPINQGFGVMDLGFMILSRGMGLIRMDSALKAQSVSELAFIIV